MPRLDLGVALVIFPEFVDLLDDLDDRLDAYEVEPQTYWLPTGDRGRPWRADLALFEHLAGRGRPIVAHGVSAPVGGSAPPDPRAVALFAESVQHLGAVATSEHLGFNVTTGADNVEVGLFLPPCPSEAGAAAAARAVAAYQQAMTVPFAIETGVSYLPMGDDELTDGEVVAAVANQSGCGIVLDLHNLWCNERNGREPVLDAVGRLPLDQVTEVHVAGGLAWDGLWLDAHSGVTPRPVMELAELVLPALPNVRLLTFEIQPAFLWRLGLDGLHAHLDDLRRLLSAASRSTIRRLARPDEHRRASGEGPQPARWEASLAGAATGWAIGDGPIDALDPRAVRVMRHLVDAGRDSRVITAAPITMRLLLAEMEGERLDGLLARYHAARPPALWGHDEAERFLCWLMDEPPSGVARLHDAIALDAARLAIARTGAPQDVPLEGDPADLLALAGARRGGRADQLWAGLGGLPSSSRAMSST